MNNIKGTPINFALNPEMPRVVPGEPPPTGDSTGKQAAQFQPSNTAALAGVVGIADPWAQNAWGWRSEATANLPGGTPAPGLFSNYSVNGLPISWPGQYSYFRRILNDPSVRFVRAMAFAPVLTTKWVVQASKDAPKDAAATIQTMFDDLRLQFLDDALRGVDYGWCGFEQCFEMLKDGPHAGTFWLTKLKALMHDLTSIYVDEHGDFNGFNNNGQLVSPVKTCLYTHDGESGNLYGRGRCWNLLEVVPWWRDANEGAARYDRKIAGVFLVCHYPPGQSINRDGHLTENYQIAQTMLDSIAAGKPIAVCNEFAGEMENNFLNNIGMADRTRWKIEMLEDKGSRQPGFSDRLAYLDRQKARAYLVPERSAFEAQKSGSKADSESHGDIILVQAAIINERLTSILNGKAIDPNSPVNNILRVNWGEAAVGTVKILPDAIQEDMKKFMRDITMQIIGDDPVTVNTLSNIQQIMAKAGMPLPTDPMSDEELTVELEGIVAKRVKAMGPVGGGGDGGKETMSRIREAVIKLNGNGHTGN